MSLAVDESAVYKAAILGLTRTSFAGLQEALKRIAEVDAKTLQVDRVSVWLFNQDHSEIACEDLYRLTLDSHENGLRLLASQYPVYFHALEENRAIMVDDAPIDPRTREFSENYLTPLGIKSMMDVPIRQQGKVIGIVCHEQTQSMRHWTSAEEQFAVSIAERVSLCLESAKRKEVERVQRACEERFEIVVRTTNDAVWDWDLVSNEVWWSEGISKLFGYNSKGVGRHVDWWLERVHPGDRDRIYSEVEKCIETGGKFWEGEYRFRCSDGSYAFILDRAHVVRDEKGKAMRMIGAMMDITARKKSEEDLKKKEEQLLHAQKLEAIGRLAGGIAHDFNNLLTVISGYSNLVSKKMPENDPSRRNLGEVLKAAEQAAILTRQLLTFSRKQEFQPKEINLNDVVSEMAPMLRRLISKQIEIVTELAPDVGSVKVDPSQIHQVLMNLAVNARDAMPKGGRLTVKTVGRDSDVMLSVSDTGCGMDEETQSKIFEPFFTTKEEGKGTGLGLSIVYGIVQQNGGSISVQSEPEKGTTFKISFPRVGSPT